jgi:hypothetical protein
MFFEVKGRGAWHQIDCLCDYETILPFLYPIRMIGEVKFNAKPLKKDKIREFIGVIKDIQENYFALDNTAIPSHRVTELGVYFSANGFDEQAEKLAFVHNIKTISYKNNYIVDRIRKYIRQLEINYLVASDCLASGRLNSFLQAFTNYLKSIDDDRLFVEFLNFARPANGIDRVLHRLSAEMGRIRASFVACTSAGVFLHFIGYTDFPVALFQNTDVQECKVHYSVIDNTDSRRYWIELSNDLERSKFYFTPPESLEEAAFYGGEIVLNEKNKIFKSLQASMKINGIKRNITIILDEKWLEKAIRDTISRE